MKNYEWLIATDSLEEFIETIIAKDSEKLVSKFNLPETYLRSSHKVFEWLQEDYKYKKK